MAKQFLLKNSLFFIMIFGYHKSCGGVIQSTGMITLSPVAEALVCQVGDQLELTCTTNGSFLRWNVTQVGNEQGVPQEYWRTVNSEDGSQQMSQVTVNSTTFTFMRTSNQNSLPLVSTLVISFVSRDLNGIVVHCVDIGASMTAVTTIIRLFEVDPIMVTTSEEYRADNVTVTVEWTQEVGVIYNITIINTVPEVPIEFIGRKSVQLTLLYNTEYNMSVEAALLCQNQVPSHVQLFYANCGYLLLPMSNDSKPSVEYVYTDLPLEGTTVNFTCPPGMALNGTNTATCMGNGEWKPDPQEVKCIEIFNCDPPSPPSDGYIQSYSQTTEGVTVSFVCQNSTVCLNGLQSSKQPVLHTAVCTSDGNWEPNLIDFCSRQCDNTIVTEKSGDVNVVTVTLATSAAVLLISNTFLFIMGCVCGHCLTQKCKKLTNREDVSNQPVPLYENLQLRATKLEPELSPNMAYGYLHVQPENAIDT